MKIGDKVKVLFCGLFSYHSEECGLEGTIIRIDNSKTFPVKLNSGNCYLKKCLKVIK